MQTKLQPSSSNHHVVPIDRSIGKAGYDHKDAISLLSKTYNFLHRACQALPSPRTLIFTTTGLLTLAAGAAFGRSLMDRQTGLQGLDNEGGILRRDIPNTLGTNSKDHFVPEPFGSSAYPFNTFPPRLPEFAETKASDWVTYESDRVKQTTLPMQNNPRLESETYKSANNIFSEKTELTPPLTDFLNSDATIEKDENIQQEDQSPHSRRKRFIGDIIAEGSSSSSFIVQVLSQPKYNPLSPDSSNTLTSCTGSIISDRHVLTAAHCSSGQPEQMKVLHKGKKYDVKEINQQQSLTSRLGQSSETDLSILTLKSNFPKNTYSLDIDTENPANQVVTFNLKKSLLLMINILNQMDQHVTTV